MSLRRGPKRTGMNSDYKKATNQVRKLFLERGKKTLEDAIHSVLTEKIECNEIQRALSYFASYWRDVFRPSLLSLACEAVGGDPSTVAPIGKSLLLLSGATDVHDDIIDKTSRKKERDTIFRRFGVNISLLTGDALLFKGFTELFDNVLRLSIPTEKKLEVVHTVGRLYFEMGDAEALELGFKGRIDVTPDEYLYVLRKKAADVEAPLRIGAILGGGSREEINALGEYGRLLGMIVLLRDDVEDILDFEGGLDSRIKNESLPLPIIYALENEEKRDDILAAMKGDLKGGRGKRLFILVSKAGGFKKLWALFKELKIEATDKIKKIKRNKKYFELILKATVPETL